MTKRFSGALLTIIATLFATLGLPTIGWAHPGHGDVASGPTHYVLEPVHAFSIAGAIVLGIAVAAFMFATKMQQRTEGE